MELYECNKRNYYELAGGKYVNHKVIKAIKISYDFLPQIQHVENIADEIKMAYNDMLSHPEYAQKRYVYYPGAKKTGYLDCDKKTNEYSVCQPEYARLYTRLFLTKKPSVNKSIFPFWIYRYGEHIFCCIENRQEHMLIYNSETTELNIANINVYIMSCNMGSCKIVSKPVVSKPVVSKTDVLRGNGSSKTKKIIEIKISDFPILFLSFPVFSNLAMLEDKSEMKNIVYGDVILRDIYDIQHQFYPNLIKVPKIDDNIVGGQFGKFTRDELKNFVLSYKTHVSEFTINVEYARTDTTKNIEDLQSDPMYEFSTFQFWTNDEYNIDVGKAMNPISNSIVKYFNNETKEDAQTKKEIHCVFGTYFDVGIYDRNKLTPLNIQRVTQILCPPCGTDKLTEVYEAVLYAGIINHIKHKFMKGSNNIFMSASGEHSIREHVDTAISNVSPASHWQHINENVGMAISKLVEPSTPLERENSITIILHVK